MAAALTEEGASLAKAVADGAQAMLEVRLPTVLPESYGFCALEAKI